jgi:DNA-binding NarL/FixJ family response regulator
MVCVVDPDESNHYRGWGASAEERGARLNLLASADEALRLARVSHVDLWVISTDLSGVSGAELCRMLRELTPGAAVYLVASEYSPEHERAARAARATLFGVKGEHIAWLDHWLDHCAAPSRPPASRANSYSNVP